MSFTTANRAGCRALAEKMTDHWEDPAYRKRLSKAMSKGATARWADKAKRQALLARRADPVVAARMIENTVLAKATLMATAYGLPLKKWQGMTKREQHIYKMTHRRVKVLKNAITKASAKKLGIPYEEYGLMSGIERAAANAAFRKKGKRK